MTGNYALPPAVLPSAGMVLFLLAMSVYAWHRRNLAGVLPFTIGCLSATLWAAGSASALAGDWPQALIRTFLRTMASFRMVGFPGLGQPISGAYIYTRAIWPPLVAAGFLVVIGLYAWRHHDVPGGKPFVAMSAGSILVLLAVVLEAAAVVPAAKIAAFKFQYVVIVACIAAVTCLVLDYAEPGRWLTRRNLVLLNIPSLVLLFLTLVDDSRLVWRRLDVLADGSIKSYFAPAGTLVTAYGFSMLLLYLVVFIRLFIRSPQHRWPVVVILLGQVASRVAFYLDNVHFVTVSFVDLSVITVLLPWTAYAIAIFGFHILDPLPAARRVVIEQMYAGMVVFDAHWRVVSLNPAAERILGLRTGAARGKTWQQLAPQTPLPALPDGRRLSGDAPETLEMTFGIGAQARHYEPALSPLRDSRGLLLGYLLVLQDVTEQKRAQAILLEQQRALAALQEREFLAHELHDSVGQVLGFANLKLGAARKLIADGRLVGADDQLAHLENVMADTHADVREYILDLHTAPTREKSFFPALRDYLGGFHQNYGIQVDLSIGSGVGEDILTPDTQIQVFRILQEALSNARKHAATNHVNVSFGMEDGRLRMRVQDNGKGFDPGQPAGAGNGHFGLVFMRERVESLGGSLQVQSAPGEGTCVEVEVPVGMTR